MTKKTLSWVCKHNYFKYLQLFKMKDTSISKDTKYFTLLTWEFPVHNVDSPVQQKGALLLNPPGCCYSSPALSSWRSGRWELRPKFHSFFLTDHKHLAWRRINYKTNIKKNLLVSSWKFNADDTMNSLCEWWGHCELEFCFSGLHASECRRVSLGHTRTCFFYIYTDWEYSVLVH